MTAMSLLRTALKARVRRPGAPRPSILVPALALILLTLLQGVGAAGFAGSARPHSSRPADAAGTSFSLGQAASPTQ